MVNRFYDDEFGEETESKKSEQKEKPSKKHSISLTEWLNSINYTKIDLMNEDNEMKYQQFIINSILSHSKELIYYIDALNCINMSNRMHYDFLLSAIPPSKRYVPFFNMKIQKNEDVELVKRYYKVSYNRANQYYEMLSEEDISKLRKYYDEGGIRRVD